VTYASASAIQFRIMISSIRRSSRDLRPQSVRIPCAGRAPAAGDTLLHQTAGSFPAARQILAGTGGLRIPVSGEPLPSPPLQLLHLCSVAKAALAKELQSSQLPNELQGTAKGASPDTGTGARGKSQRLSDQHGTTRSGDAVARCTNRRSSRRGLKTMARATSRPPFVQRPAACTR